MIVFVLLFSCTTKIITGKVLEKQTPLQGVTCTFLEQNFVTDISGQYVFDDLNVNKGEYSIRCTKEGYQFVEENLLITGRTAEIPTMVMQPILVKIPYLELNLDPESSLND